MSEGVSEIEENTLRVLLSTLRKHAPDTLKQIIFDVMMMGLGEKDVAVFLKAEDSSDDAIVESAVMAVRGAKNTARFFSALEAAQLDDAEDTDLS